MRVHVLTNKKFKGNTQAYLQKLQTKLCSISYLDHVDSNDTIDKIYSQISN